MVTIRTFRADDQPAFKALNLSWIERHFEVEVTDLAQLDDPVGTILDRGGAIFIAELDDEIVGTIGILPAHTPGIQELFKMTVAQAARRKGVGAALIGAVMKEARNRGANRIWLETNSALEAATRLYEAQGFRHATATEWIESPYSRCNVQMICDL
ncbi:MAG: GNAT family N-acetyltransferase [Pseudomonadota bacterium]